MLDFFNDLLNSKTDLSIKSEQNFLETNKETLSRDLDLDKVTDVLRSNKKQDVAGKFVSSIMESLEDGQLDAVSRNCSKGFVGFIPGIGATEAELSEVEKLVKQRLTICEQAEKFKAEGGSVEIITDKKNKF